MRELLKSSRIYLHLVNLFTTYPVMYHIMLGIILTITLSNCYNKPVNKNNITMEMVIQDIRKEIHEYNVEIKIQSHEKDVLYCKKHFGWEIIKAYWNPKIDGYDYIVSKHKKF